MDKYTDTITIDTDGHDLKEKSTGANVATFMKLKDGKEYEDGKEDYFTYGMVSNQRTPIEKLEKTKLLLDDLGIKSEFENDGYNTAVLEVKGKEADKLIEYAQSKTIKPEQLSSGVEGSDIYR